MEQKIYKFSDAELSERVGKYQNRARIAIIVGVLMIITGFISMLVISEPTLKTLLAAVLAVGGFAVAIFVGGGEQKKLKKLIDEQLGQFFDEKAEKMFGKTLNSAEMTINESLMKSFAIRDGEWEKCSVENFREGICDGVGFSAANVRLEHVYQRGTPQDGLGESRDIIFEGVVIRRKNFAGVGDSPEFLAKLADFEKAIVGRVAGFSCENGIFSVAIETVYAFARVAGNVDMRDIDAVRKSYLDSIVEMKRILEILPTAE